MANDRRGIGEYLDDCFEKFVAPLVSDLRLKVKQRTVEGLGGMYEIESEVLLIRLINDRGFTDLSIAPRHARDDYWDMQLIEALFRGHPHRGVWQPTLEEQANRLRESWSELNTLFSPLNFAETHEKLCKLGEERAVRLFGPNFFRMPSNST